MPVEDGAADLVRLSPERLAPWPGLNPRRHVREERIREIAASLREEGQLMNLVVHDTGEDVLWIVAGETRWRAAKRLASYGDPIQLVCSVRVYDERRAFKIAMLENTQRGDLTVLEQARGFRRMIDEYGYTQESIAAEILGDSRKQSQVAKRLGLLVLPESVLELVEMEVIPWSYAYDHLVAWTREEEDLQAKLFPALVESIRTARDFGGPVARSWFVDQVEQIAKAHRPAPPAADPAQIDWAVAETPGDPFPAPLEAITPHVQFPPEGIQVDELLPGDEVAPRPGAIIYEIIEVRSEGNRPTKAKPWRLQCRQIGNGGFPGFLEVAQIDAGRWYLNDGRELVVLSRPEPIVAAATAPAAAPVPTAPAASQAAPIAPNPVARHMDRVQRLYGADAPPAAATSEEADPDVTAALAIIASAADAFPVPPLPARVVPITEYSGPLPKEKPFGVRGEITHIRLVDGDRPSIYDHEILARSGANGWNHSYLRERIVDAVQARDLVAAVALGHRLSEVEAESAHLSDLWAQRCARLRGGDAEHPPDMPKVAPSTPVSPLGAIRPRAAGHRATKIPADRLVTYPALLELRLLHLEEAYEGLGAARGPGRLEAARRTLERRYRSLGAWLADHRMRLGEQVLERVHDIGFEVDVPSIDELIEQRENAAAAAAQARLEEAARRAELPDVGTIFDPVRLPEALWGYRVAGRWHTSPDRKGLAGFAQVMNPAEVAALDAWAGESFAAAPDQGQAPAAVEEESQVRQLRPHETHVGRMVDAAKAAHGIDPTHGAALHFDYGASYAIAPTEPKKRRGGRLERDEDVAQWPEWHKGRAWAQANREELLAANAVDLAEGRPGARRHWPKPEGDERTTSPAPAAESSTPAPEPTPELERQADQAETTEGEVVRVTPAAPLPPQVDAKGFDLPALPGEPPVWSRVRGKIGHQTGEGVVCGYFVAADGERRADLTGVDDISWSCGAPPCDLEVIAPPPTPIASTVTKKEIDLAFVEWFRSRGPYASSYGPDGKPKKGHSGVRDMEASYRHWWRQGVQWAGLGFPRPTSGSGRIEAWDWRMARHRELFPEPAEARPADGAGEQQGRHADFRWAEEQHRATETAGRVADNSDLVTAG